MLVKAILDVGIENVMYCDTDSLIFKGPSGVIEEGDGLGQWKNEIKAGERLIGCVALGNKEYCLLFMRANGSIYEKVRFKGIKKEYDSDE